MRKLLLASTLLAAVGAAPAEAKLSVAFLSGGASACQDGDACDIAGSTGNLLVVQTVVGNFTINGTFAHSQTNPDTLIASNLSITNTGSSTDTLFFAVGDTNFTGNVGSFRTTASGSFNGIGNASFEWFVDGLNTQGGLTGTDTPGALLQTFLANGLGGLDSFSESQNFAHIASGPFSMAEGMALTLDGGATIFTQGQGVAAVPEPKTWAMAAIGFAMLGFIGLKRSRKDRFAVAA